MKSIASVVAVTAVFVLAPVEAGAQPGLDIEYAAEQKALQEAIEAAAGSTRAAIVLPVAALENPIAAQSFTSIATDPESKVAMEGYDPVGYFTRGEAMPGSPVFSAEYEGAIFYFANAEHRDMFMTSPAQYVPAYGGYCAETLAMGALTPASPLHWNVHGNRLYLTRSAATNEAFREHRHGSMKAANAQFIRAESFVEKLNYKATRQ